MASENLARSSDREAPEQDLEDTWDPRPRARRYLCPHEERRTTYTREPCICGRDLWPPRGRGRGEALSSPRRVVAQSRIPEMIEMYGKGATWAQIAEAFGYAGPSGPWQLVYRTLDQLDEPGEGRGGRFVHFGKRLHRSVVRARMRVTPLGQGPSRPETH